MIFPRFSINLLEFFACSAGNDWSVLRHTHTRWRLISLFYTVSDLQKLSISKV